MEVVYRAKGSGMYRLAFFVIMAILVNAYCCASAAVLVKTNTTFRCDGRLDECLVEDDLEFDFLINPYVTRILNAPGQTGTGGTGGPNNAACGPQNGGSPQYKCSPDSKSSGNHGCVTTSAFKRCGG